MGGGQHLLLAAAAAANTTADGKISRLLLIFISRVKLSAANICDEAYVAEWSAKYLSYFIMTFIRVNNIFSTKRLSCAGERLCSKRIV